MASTGSDWSLSHNRSPLYDARALGLFFLDPRNQCTNRPSKRSSLGSCLNPPCFLAAHRKLQPHGRGRPGPAPLPHPHPGHAFGCVHNPLQNASPDSSKEHGSPPSPAPKPTTSRWSYFREPRRLSLRYRRHLLPDPPRHRAPAGTRWGAKLTSPLGCYAPGRASRPRRQVRTVTDTGCADKRAGVPAARPCDPGVTALSGRSLLPPKSGPRSSGAGTAARRARGCGCGCGAATR